MNKKVVLSFFLLSLLFLVSIIVVNGSEQETTLVRPNTTLSALDQVGLSRPFQAISGTVNLTVHVNASEYCIWGGYAVNTCNVTFYNNDTLIGTASNKTVSTSLSIFSIEWDTTVVSGGVNITFWSNVSDPGTILSRISTSAHRLNSTVLEIDNAGPSVTLGGGNTSLVDNYVVDIGTGTLGSILLMANATDRHLDECQGAIQFNVNGTNSRHENSSVFATAAAGQDYGEFNLTSFIGPDGAYEWGVICNDNATSTNSLTADGMGEIYRNRGVPSSGNFTFYIDGKVPTYDSTNPVVLADSDPNDNNKAGTNPNLINGEYYTEVNEEISITCDASDTSLNKIEFLVKRPGQSQFKVVQTEAGFNPSTTFTYKDTAVIGVYEVKCIAYDGASNSKESSKVKFRLIAEDPGVATSGSGGGSGSGGSSGTSAALSLGVNNPSGVLVRPRGAIVDIQVAGTQHEIRFNEVTATSATLTISSTPSTFTLVLGGSQLVDLDDDGTNDVEVTLESVVLGQARISFDYLGDLPSEGIPTPGGPSEPTAGSGDGVAGTAPTASSRTGLWVIVIIVVVGVVGYFVYMAQKKKKQQ